MSSPNIYRDRARRSRQRAEQDTRNHPDRVLTFREWCALNSFSAATGNRILRGNGPKPAVIWFSKRRFGIKQAANAAWQERCTRKP